MWKWGRPPRLPGPAGPKEHFPSGYPYPTLPGAQPSLSGVRPPPGFTGTPRGPGNFHGRGNCQPSGRHHPSTVNDTALSGHSALPGLSALPGQSSHLAAIHGDTPMHGPSSPALPDQLSISLPGISRLPGAQPSLLGVRPTPGFTGTPMGSGEFSGLGQTPAIRQASTPLLWWN